MRSSVVQPNFLQGSREYPYHVSVGAVLVNAEGKVCAHHFDELQLGDRYAKDFYILMRETPEPGESTEASLRRGLREEFGAVGTIRHYIGSLIAALDTPKIVEKTTLYFLCDTVEQDNTKREDHDIESISRVGWYDIDFLIEQMKRQAVEIGYQDINEASILERSKQYINL